MQAEVGKNLGANTNFLLRRRLTHVAIVADQLAIFQVQSEGGLMQVNEHALTFIHNSAEGIANYSLAVAPGRTEQVPISAMRVHANQHVLFARHVAMNQREMRFRSNVARIEYGSKVSRRRRDAPFTAAVNVLLVSETSSG